MSRSMSLERKLPLYLTAVLAVVVVTLAAGAFREVRRSQLDAAAERLRRVSQQLGDLTLQSIRQRQSEVAEVAGAPEIGALLRAPDRGERQEAALGILEEAAQPSQVVMVEVRDAVGRRVLWTGDKTRALDLAPRGIPDEPETGALARVGNDLVYPSRIGVREGGEPIGTVTVWRSTTINPAGRQVLTDLIGADAVLLLGSQGGAWTDLVDPATPPPLGTDPEDGIASYERGGVATLASVRSLDPAPWYLVVELPRAAVLARSRAFLTRLALLSPIALILVAVSAWLLGRSITGPLRETTVAAEAIAAGHPGHRVQVRSMDEVGRLAVSFNTMVQRVEDSQAALLEANDSLRKMLDGAPLPIIALDLSGRVRMWNRACTRILGWRESDVLGRPSPLVPADGSALEVPADLSRASVGVEVKVLRQDGEQIFLNVARAPTYDPQGAVDGYMLVCEDVTARRRAEEALRESEERLNLALRSAGVGSWMWDVKGDRIVWDEHLHPLFGLAPGTFGGTYADFMKTVHPDDRSSVRAEVRKHIRESSDYDIEFRAVWPDGSVRHLASRGKIFRGAEGRAHRMTGVCWDITARKRGEEQLAQYAAELARSNAELQHFAYVASHDLQEPLRMVKSYTQLLAKRYSGRLDPDADDFIHFAVDGATRMQRLISDLLEYSRVDSRARPFEVTSADTILCQALDNLATTIAETGATVTHDPLPVITCDGSQLVRVFQNLVANGIKFRRGDGPRIHVSSRTEETQHVFSVRDDGIGIDEDYYERIFVIFQRLHGPTDFEGTGIGLAICKKIVERHGGRIWVDSVPGEGATFQFTIPARTEDAA